MCSHPPRPAQRVSFASTRSAERLSGRRLVSRACRCRVVWAARPAIPRGRICASQLQASSAGRMVLGLGWRQRRHAPRVAVAQDACQRPHKSLARQGFRNRVVSVSAVPHFFQIRQPLQRLLGSLARRASAVSWCGGRTRASVSRSTRYALWCGSVLSKCMVRADKAPRILPTLGDLTDECVKTDSLLAA